MKSPHATSISFLATALVAAALVSSGRAQTTEESAEPALPKNATAAESLAPLPRAPRAVTPPPIGPVHCAAEYEPMEGILMAWEGPNSWRQILAQMAAHITATGNADVFVYVDTTAEQTSAAASITAAGAVASRVQFRVRQTDSIWMRDYGPRYIYQGDCRAIIDHTYNRPRFSDNAVPSHFGPTKGHRVYELPLVHGGGNYHLDALGRSYTTRLILNENPTLTEPQIATIWQDYQNVATTFTNPFPTNIDSTQHIDMWMQVFGDNEVMISDWPFNSGSVQDQICDQTAAAMTANGYTVTRVPARSVGGTHYTYTNVVVCNDLILVPQYTQSSVTQHNAPALAAWRAAAPTKTIQPINCQAIVTAAGVMHCIVMHVPAPRGGAIPTAFAVTGNTAASYAPGQVINLEWLADDDVGVTQVDLAWSADGGVTFPYTIATGIPHRGSVPWTIPRIHTTRGRLRVTARDAQGNTGVDVSQVNFSISSSVCQASSTRYGAGKPGTGGTPDLSTDLPRMGDAMGLQLTTVRSNAPVVLILGTGRATVAFDGATILVAASSTIDGTTTAQGNWNTSFPIPTAIALCGLQANIQAWSPNDPVATGAGWTCSNGVELQIGW